MKNENEWNFKAKLEIIMIIDENQVMYNLNVLYQENKGN